MGKQWQAMASNGKRWQAMASMSMATLPTVVSIFFKNSDPTLTESLICYDRPGSNVLFFLQIMGSIATECNRVVPCSATEKQALGKPLIWLPVFECSVGRWWLVCSWSLAIRKIYHLYSCMPNFSGMGTSVRETYTIDVSWSQRVLNVISTRCASWAKATSIIFKHWPLAPEVQQGLFTPRRSKAMPREADLT